MAAITLSGAVGAPPATNATDDVRKVQTLLNAVQPPLSKPVTVTGSIDQATITAIREFQRRFMSNPDGRVDPDNRTLLHLNDGFSPRYIGCNPIQRRTLDRAIINAKKWLDVVNRRLADNSDTDMKRVVRNVFHINADDQTQASRFADLRSRMVRLRNALDQSFPLECQATASLFGAWVDINDATGTMHFPPSFFQQSSDERDETVIHERAHTVFHIEHAGMSGAGEINIGQAADADNGFTYDQAIANAYCYGWLATALQPGYTPPEGDVIVVPRPHH
jgi:hypothetical protein